MASGEGGKVTADPSGRNRPARGDAARRRALLVFGVGLVVLFAIVAIAEGIGGKGVPSGDVAVVEGVPESISTISQEEFDHAIEQQLAQAKLEKAPPPGSDKFEELKEAALGELLDQIWIRGEAEAHGVEASAKEMDEALAQVKEQSFPAKGAFEKFLKESKFTQEDVNDRLEVQVLSGEIQEAVNKEVPAPSDSEVESYYESEKATQFTDKESRDVRIVLNEDKAKVEAAKRELEKDSSPASWKKVAPRYSSDPTSSSKGGLQEGITEEFLQGPLKEAIFGSEVGELKGPVKFQNNYVLVEVVKQTPEKPKPLDEVRAQIEETLKGERQQEFFSEFVSGYQSTWEARTHCADGYVIERCANFVGSGHPAEAPPACYEEDPKQGLPEDGCPAPVLQVKPAAPGSVTPLEPKGEQMAQRPQPTSGGQAEEAASAPLPTE